MRASLVFAAALPLLARSPTATAQTLVPKNAAERLKAVADVTSLESFSKPWHLKLSVTLVDARSGNTDATIEVWRSGKESRTVASTPGSTTRQYEHADQRYDTHEGPPIPQVVFDALDAVLHPGPQPRDFVDTNPEQRTQEFGKTPLECVMLSRPMKPESGGQMPPVVPIGLFPTWCMLPKSDHLQFIASYGNPSIQINALGKFGDREVVTALTLAEGTTPLARAKVLTLSTFVPSEGEFLPPPELKPAGDPVIVIQGGVVKGSKIGGTIPHYPESARMAHIAGTVLLHAIIGTDGHIQHLTVISAPHPDLAISALQAVRTWTYDPYLLTGQPTRIDTTITVHFNISPG